MTPHEYLGKIIVSQTLSEDSDELKALRKRRDEVEGHLRDAFGPDPTIRYGGSQAKGTLIKESYDLDIVCYFPRDEDEAGETLEELYTATKDAMSKHYVVDPKTCALRLKGLDNADFHVDVVPGRFVDESGDDVFLYQAGSDKCRLKTNIETHISHVRDSGVTNAIKLTKLWRTRLSLPLKTFILELIVVDVLGGSGALLDKQMRKLFETLRDEPEGITVEDPANPFGNDLSNAWDDDTRTAVSAAAKATLQTVDSSGWEAVFGALPTSPVRAIFPPVPVRPNKPAGFA